LPSAAFPLPNRRKFSARVALRLAAQSRRNAALSRGLRDVVVTVKINQDAAAVGLDRRVRRDSLRGGVSQRERRTCLIDANVAERIYDYRK
jgi:hypothetical protein